MTDDQAERLIRALEALVLALGRQNVPAFMPYQQEPYPPTQSPLPDFYPRFAMRDQAKQGNVS
jgi:hypothetical protein